MISLVIKNNHDTAQKMSWIIANHQLWDTSDVCDNLFYSEYYTSNTLTVWKWTFLGDGDLLPGLARADLCGDAGGMGTG